LLSLISCSSFVLARVIRSNPISQGTLVGKHFE